MASVTAPHDAPPTTNPDPRELDDAFQRLPPRAQADLRAAWRQRADQDAAIALRQRRFRTRSCIEGAVALGLMQGFFGSHSVLMILPAAVLGAGLGWLWYVLRAGRALCILTGGLSWCGLLLWEPLAGMLLIKSVVVVCVLLAAIGVGRESWYRSDAIGW